MPGSPASGPLTSDPLISGPLRQRLRELWHDDRSTRATPLLCAALVLAVLWLTAR
jgi:hypothetical protein